MIFAHQLQRIDPNNPEEAIKKMANHITYLQEQLEYTLLNLDSRNINEIDTNQTVITNTTGTTNIGGSYISIQGDKGESFVVGKNDKGKFEFTVKGKDGTQIAFTDEGNLSITTNAVISVDGGEW